MGRGGGGGGGLKGHCHGHFDLFSKTAPKLQLMQEMLLERKGKDI